MLCVVTCSLFVMGINSLDQHFFDVKHFHRFQIDAVRHRNLQGPLPDGFVTVYQFSGKTTCSQNSLQDNECKSFGINPSVERCFFGDPDAGLQLHKNRAAFQRITEEELSKKNKRTVELKAPQPGAVKNNSERDAVEIHIGGMGVKCFLIEVLMVFFVYVSDSKTVQRCPNTHPFAYNNGANCCEVPFNKVGDGQIFYNINKNSDIPCPKQPCYTLEPMVGFQWYHRLLVLK